MSKAIEHRGTIESIDGSHIQVRILQMSACSGCHAKSLCSSEESKEKLIDVFIHDSSSYSLGEEVKVMGAMTMGRNAVLLSFGLPLVLIVLWVTISALFLSIGEQYIMVGIAVLLAIYYLALHSLQNRLQKTFSFWIEKIS